jgi:hypothetical protein
MSKILAVLVVNPIEYIHLQPGEIVQIGLKILNNKAAETIFRQPGCLFTSKQTLSFAPPLHSGFAFSRSIFTANPPVLQLFFRGRR